MSICNFSYFPFWFRDQDFGSDCINSWQLLTLENLHAGLTNTCFEPQWKWEWGLGSRKVYLNPPVMYYWPFQIGAFVVVPSCSVYVSSILPIDFTIMYVISIQLRSISESPPVWERAADTVCHIVFVCRRHFVLRLLFLVILLAGFGIWLYQFLILALFNFYFDIVLATHLIL